jgi:tRNA pseudouridine38-40 synthase
MERHAYRVAVPLDDEAMAVALRLLNGRHDFAPLSGPVPAGKSTVRNIYATGLWKEGETVRFEVEANAFLPHQMRRIAGMLESVGSGRLSLEGVLSLLNGTSDQTRMKQVTSAPPQGLCLVQVKYEDFPPNAY